MNSLYASLEQRWTNALGVALMLCLVGLGFVWTGVTQHWSNQVYDWFQKVSLPGIHKSDVVVIEINAQSLRQIGRWPWPRLVHAELLDKLTRAGAKVVAFDIHFSEPGQHDDQLAKAIQRNGRVVLPVFWEKSEAGFILSKPLEPFIKAGAVLGHTHVDFDSDGVARRTCLLTNTQSGQWPSLGQAMIWQANQGPSAKQLTFIRGEQSGFCESSAMIPFSRPDQYFRALSYTTVLKSTDRQLEKLSLRDKYVLVGPTAAGLSPFVMTPTSGDKKAIPGVVFQALALDVLISGEVVTPFSLSMQLALTALFILTPVLLYYVFRNEWVIITTGSLFVVALGFSFVALKFFNLWFPPMPVLVTLALSYPLWGWRRLKHVGHDLSREQNQIKLTAQSIADGVITTDASGRVVYLNPVAEHMTGLKLNEVHGQSFDQVLHLDDNQQQHLMSWLKNSQHRNTVSLKSLGQTALKSRSGRDYNVSISASLLRDRGGVQGMVLAICDLTEVKREARKVAFLVSHEKLTRLPNRSLLKEHIRRVMKHNRNPDQLMSIYFINLDNFKRINDVLGRAVGDRILRIVAKRLKAMRQENDFVAHLGGDEFAFVFAHVKNKIQALEFAGELVERLGHRINVDNHQLHLSASIGISLYPDDGQDDEMLISKADVAMRHAKTLGRNNFQLFSSEMDYFLSQTLHLEQDLRAAIQNNELELYYQPQIDIETGAIRGLEALTRWRRSDGKFVEPSIFISVAEETGLIHSLGKWVLEESCRQAKIWQEKGIPPVRIAVNLSPRQFMSNDVVSVIRGALANSGLDAKYLEIEITESAVMQNYAKALETLLQFKALGGQVSLDDFGIGYSSFSRLKNLPIDQLKIDRSFVLDIVASKADAAVTHAMITMAHDMGIDVIAEGVESRQQIEILKQQDCDEFQGYFFSRPLPATDIGELLQRVSKGINTGSKAPV